MKPRLELEVIQQSQRDGIKSHFTQTNPLKSQIAFKDDAFSSNEGIKLSQLTVTQNDDIAER